MIIEIELIDDWSCLNHDHPSHHQWSSHCDSQCEWHWQWQSRSPSHTHSHAPTHSHNQWIDYTRGYIHTRHSDTDRWFISFSWLIPNRCEYQHCWLYLLVVNVTDSPRWYTCTGLQQRQWKMRRGLLMKCWRKKRLYNKKAQNKMSNSRSIFCG